MPRAAPSDDDDEASAGPTGAPRSRRAARRGTRSGSRCRGRVSRMSSATALMSRPPTSTPTSMSRDDAVVADDVRARGRPRRRPPRPRRPGRRRRLVDAELADALDACRRVSGVPQTTTSKTFCSSKRLPDLDAREHRRRGPPHVTGLDAERLGPVEVDLDSERRAPAAAPRPPAPRRRRPRATALRTVRPWRGASRGSCAEHPHGQVLALRRRRACELVVDALPRDR